MKRATEDKQIAKMQDAKVDFTTVAGLTVKDIDDSIKIRSNLKNRTV